MTESTENPQQLSLLVKLSIGALLLVGVITTVLLLANSVEFARSRAFATIVLFVYFVFATLLATRSKRMPVWFAPLLVGVSFYILFVGMVHTWAFGFAHMNDYTYYGTGFEIALYPIGLILSMVLSFWLAHLILWLTSRRAAHMHGALAFKSGVASAALLLLAAALVTLPVVFQVFGYDVIDLYWRINVAILVFSGVFLAIAVLLAFANRAENVPSGAAFAAKTNPAQGTAATAPFADGVVTGSARSVADANTVGASNLAADSNKVADTNVAADASVGGNAEANHVPAQADSAHTNSAAAAQSLPQLDENGLLPWPTFADGTPLPALPDGQPDFSVPGAPYPPHLLLEEARAQAAAEQS